VWPFADWRPSSFDGRNEGKNGDLRSPFKMKGEAKGRGPTMEAKGKEGRPRTAQMGPPATASMRRPMRSDG
jgi:hypothetical protein